MRSLILITILFAAFVLFGPPSAVAQQSVGDWSNIESLKSRTRVIVETRNGTIYTGGIAAAAPDSITIVSDGRQTTIVRDDVESVHLGRRSSIFKRAFVGAGVGGLIGLAAGAAATIITGEGRGLLAAQGLLYGIPAGAVIGAATGGTIKRGRLIYRAT